MLECGLGHDQPRGDTGGESSEGWKSSHGSRGVLGLRLALGKYSTERKIGWIEGASGLKK
jgi:hypothetical protein